MFKFKKKKIFRNHLQLFSLKYKAKSNNVCKGSWKKTWIFNSLQQTHIHTHKISLKKITKDIKRHRHSKCDSFDLPYRLYLSEKYRKVLCYTYQRQQEKLVVQKKSNSGWDFESIERRKNASMCLISWNAIPSLFFVLFNYFWTIFMLWFCTLMIFRLCNFYCKKEKVNDSEKNRIKNSMKKKYAKDSLRGKWLNEWDELCQNMDSRWNLRKNKQNLI